MNYGLIEELKELTAYVLGQSKMPYIYYVENGDWRPYKPTFEHQAPYFETSACTAFTVESQIQYFMKAIYNEDVDYSENFLALTVPIKVGKGVDPQKTYEAVRNSGMIFNNELRAGKTVSEWSDETRLTKSIQAKGLYWLEKNSFYHEWLWDSPENRPNNYIEILRDALKTSPIGISVSAWEKEIDEWGNEVYVSKGNVNNHKTLCVCIDEEGYPWVDDSYEPRYKRLSKDHNIRRAKRIWINKKTKASMRQHIRVLENILKSLKLMKPTLADVARKYLGTDASPQDNAPDDVGCSESVTTILKSVYPETPIILGTWSLWLYLRNPKNGWVEVTDPQPGTIILSPTGTGTGIGHVGICMENDLIASSNSFGVLKGKFTENYTQQSWNKKYTVGQKMKTFLYRRAV